MVAISERAELALTESYRDAAEASASRLTAVDTVLSDIITQISEVKVTSAAGRSTVLSSNERITLAQKIEGLRRSLAGAFNAQFRGTYVFAGTAATTVPFPVAADGTVGPYQGNAFVTQVAVSRNETVQISFDGETIAGASDATGLFGVLDSLIEAVRTGDMAQIDAGIAGLDRAFDRVTRVQSVVGNALSALEGQRSRLDALRLRSLERISQAEDANLAEAITNMTRAETAPRAARAAPARRARPSRQG
jgi:flagellar hook-associated protein 3 FlgL